jgi:mRNA-degrading endonuclease RelE of RelBE toxin-antitoxin system
MHYRLIIRDEAKRKIRLLPKRIRKEVGYRLFLMQEDLAGQIKKLKADKSAYRLGWLIIAYLLNSKTT